MCALPQINRLQHKKNLHISKKSMTTWKKSALCHHTPHHSLDHPPPRHHVAQLPQLASGILAPSAKLVIVLPVVVTGMATKKALQSADPAIVAQPLVV